MLRIPALPLPPPVAGRDQPVTPCHGTLVSVTDQSQQVAIISACSGYGGLDEAVKAVTGGTVVAHIEYDEAPSKILEHRYPGVPNYGDLTTADWPAIVAEHVPDGARWVLCAGYPCQPFSSAGKRRGVEDHRHLWPYLAEAIRQTRPDLVVFENVRNHLNLGFDVVLAELADLGYDVTWTLLRASDVGAPHGRARLFIVGRRKVAAAPGRVPLARVDGEGGWNEPSDGLFGALPWAGKIPTTGRVVAGGMYPFTLPGHLADAPEREVDDDDPFADLLPTPRGAAVRTSRKALTADGQWSAPSLEQALEMARGELPREYESWDEVRGRSAGMEPKLLATPDAGVFNDGQDVEVWKERNAREREKGYNGNGGGVPLAMQVRLLPTPEAKLSDSGPDYARAERDGSGGDDLTTTVFRAFVNDDDGDPARLLPTPTCQDGANTAGPSQFRRNSLPLNTLVVAIEGSDELLPSPTASDGERTTVAYGRGNPTLSGAAEGVQLLPTPTAIDSSFDSPRASAEEWAAWKAERASRGVATGQGMLADAVGHLPQGKLLPTPEAADGSGGRITTEKGGTRPSGAKRAIYLATAVAHDIVCDQAEDDELVLHVVTDEEVAEDGELFPTPRATRGGSGTETMYALGAERADQDRPQGEVLLPGEQRLFPSPRAVDATKGSPNQHGSSGDLMLVPAVMQLIPEEEGGAWRRDPVTGERLLPSPTAGDALGSRNSTCYRGPDAGEHNAGTTLTDVAWEAAGASGPTRKEDEPDYAPITDWGPYAAAVARWASVVGEAPAPTEPNSKGKQRLAPVFPEWMMGLPRGWVTDVPGISRNAKLKAIGNGVCPQQGYVAISRQLAAIPAW